jgi:endonuclease/exonuclease/phosphatase family metal-dependent hydrolase
LNTASKPKIDAAAAAHPYEPMVENRPSSRVEGPLRVVAFNARGGMRFGGIVECFTREPLRSASIILLSEVDFDTWRSGRRRVASELAVKLGMSCAYIKEFGLIYRDGQVHAYLGNAILSREPLEEVYAVPIPRLTTATRRLPTALGRPRRTGGPAALVASVSRGGARIRVCVAHLDSRASPAGREHQMMSLLEQFPADGPAIIGGDLNTTTLELARPEHAKAVLREMLLNSRRFRHPIPHEPLFGRLAEAGFEVDGANAEGRATFTFSRIIPPWLRPRLDWIALRELEPVPGSAAVIPARPNFLSPRVSDHDFIVVDIAD